MATNRAKPTRRMTARAVEDEVRGTAHVLATALHRAGAIDTVGMRGVDRFFSPPRTDDRGHEERRIRAATRMSQPVFARLLGVEKSAVAQWERGAKRPSGPALRLLEVLDPNKPESPIVQVRRNMVENAA